MYANEIIAAVEETRFDFNLWVEDLTNPEKKDWLIMDVAKVRSINQNCFTADFPPYEEIETWVIPVTNENNKKWTIRGKNLASILEQMKLCSHSN